MFSARRNDPGRLPKGQAESDSPRSTAPGGSAGRDEVARDLQKLYDSSRGALYANSLIQAQEAFEEGDFAKTLELVQASRDVFRVRHKKTLQQDPKKPDGKKKPSKQEVRALEHKQAKLNATLGLFDATLGHLEKMARLQHMAVPPPAVDTAVRRGAPDPAAQPDDELPDALFAEFAAAQTDDDRCHVVYRHFDVGLVGSYDDIRPGAVYFFRAGEGHLIRITGVEPRTDLASINVLPSGQRMKPVARAKLVELGKKAQLLLLAPKQPDDEAGDEPAARGWTPAGPEKTYVDSMVDMGSFTQLFTAAQQSGIVSGADQIAHVRDREFRMGKHQAALDVIERLYVKFNQELAQRQQKLRAEELDYRAGKLKMSPKQWQAKKQRDTLQTQIIERTRRSFARVLGGLRVMIATK